jgi:hypothetical protein
MHPDTVAEHPPRGGVLEALAWLVRKRRLVVLEPIFRTSLGPLRHF